MAAGGISRSKRIKPFNAKHAVLRLDGGAFNDGSCTMWHSRKASSALHIREQGRGVTIPQKGVSAQDGNYFNTPNPPFTYD